MPSSVWRGCSCYQFLSIVFNCSLRELFSKICIPLALVSKFRADFPFILSLALHHEFSLRILHLRHFQFQFASIFPRSLTYISIQFIWDALVRIQNYWFTTLKPEFQIRNLQAVFGAFKSLKFFAVYLSRHQPPLWHSCYTRIHSFLVTLLDLIAL